MTKVFETAEEIVPYIQNSNLRIPEDVNNYDKEEYMHFHIFLNSHLHGPMIVEELENNANIIAQIHDTHIASVSMFVLTMLGCQFDWGATTSLFNEN